MAAARDVDEQLRVLTTNAVHVETEADLRRKLERGRPLRVKLGIDPTASDIHLGFAVVLRKLRQFQTLGHTAVLILGDFTAQVGDPSGRSATRPRLSKDEVDANAATYVEQMRRILLPELLEVRRNSEWLATMGIEDVLRLTARTTVARMLERDDFANRYRDGKPISLMELLYPLLQGWDSVMVKSDVELGGTDQLFNNLMGRTLQEQEGQEGQVVLTMPLLVGLDGTQKMSKSLGNFVGVEEPPAEQFGKLMSLSDTLISQYFVLTSDAPPQQVTDFTKRLERGDVSPVDAKRELARTVVDLYHGDGAGAAAEAEFDRVFKSHEPPTNVESHDISAAELGPTVSAARLARLLGLVASNNEGRRLVEQGGLRINGEKVADPDQDLPLADLEGALVQKGRREWARVHVVP
jgi:tyrosyl-tRNA synthetase